MTRTALALSPHLDDASFSCGGTLAKLARSGWRVVVATLFTRSVPNPQGFALACQLDKGLGPEVDYMALRRAEDVAAMLALGVEPPIHVPLPEAPHRGYHSAQALFGSPMVADDISRDLKAAIADLLTVHAPDLLLAPQAFGGHVDHVQVVRALKDVASPILWWRDFPYVVRTATPSEPFEATMAGKPEHSIEVDAVDRDAKQAACLAYASQLGFQFGGADGLRKRLSQAGMVEHFRSDGAVAVD